MSQTETNASDNFTGYAQAFTTGEVIFLTTINLALVVVAVVGNAIVCVLLRFRYMRLFRYLRRWCCNCDNRNALQTYTAPNELWAEEYPSSQHECSCGKQYATNLNSVMNNRCVVFTPGRQLPIAYTGPVNRNQYTNTTLPNHLSTKHHRSFKRYARVGKQSSITSLFLFNLSLADFLMALLIVPIHVIVEIIYLSWPLGHTMCKLSSYLQGTSVFVSALTHVVISWDRVILVYFPLRPRMSHRSAVSLIMGVWILACIIPFPMLVVNQLQADNHSTHCVEDWTVLFPNLIVNRTSNPPQFMFELELWSGNNLVIEISSAYTVLLMILQYFLPLGVICGTYAAIAMRVKRLQTPGERDMMRDQKLSKARRKMVKMLTTVAILYGLSQLPRHIVYLHGSLHREFWQTSWSVRLWTAVSFTRDTSTCYNPFVYAWVNKPYRKEVYRLLRPFGAPCRMLRNCCEHLRRRISKSGSSNANTGSGPLPSVHSTSQLRPLNFTEAFNDMRMVNSVPSFGSRCKVIPNCYNVALSVQSSGSTSSPQLVRHLTMPSLAR